MTNKERAQKILDLKYDGQISTLTDWIMRELDAAEERGQRESLRGYAKELEDSADFYDKEMSVHKEAVAVLRAKASLLRERIEEKK